MSEQPRECVRVVCREASRGSVTHAGRSSRVKHHKTTWVVVNPLVAGRNWRLLPKRPQPTVSPGQGKLRSLRLDCRTRMPQSLEVSWSTVYSDDFSIWVSRKTYLPLHQWFDECKFMIADFTTNDRQTEADGGTASFAARRAGRNSERWLEPRWTTKPKPTILSESSATRISSLGKSLPLDPLVCYSTYFHYI